MTFSIRRLPLLLSAGSMLLAIPLVNAGSHTWDVVEAFSNPSGSIWFIEMEEPLGGALEIAVGGHIFSSTTNSFSICILTSAPATCNVAAPTGFKHILFGNPAYAELAAADGAPLPDQVINTNAFFNVAGDTLSYIAWDSWIFGAVPTDGVRSLNRTGGSLPNTPQNYAAGVAGSVNASTPPPSVVPDGSVAGSQPMRVDKLLPAGASLRIFWDTQQCLLDPNHHIVIGQGSDLPGAPGGLYGVSGGVCGLGGASPFTWNATPNSTDGSGLIWWLVVVNDGSAIEGSWGTRNGVNERQGPGASGSSGQCAIATKDVSNACGS